MAHLKRLGCMTILMSSIVALGNEPPATAPRRPAPTHADVSYGPHVRNVMDIWLAPSDRPTPVLVAIHGGGFYTGKKNVDAALLNECLASGISVVAIAYRYSTDAIAPAPLLDGARAVQFLRANADRWNLDPNRFAAIGGSAGGAMSLWLAFHDDLADPASEDPIARQSTRLSCAIALNGQTTYDPREIRRLFPEFDVTKHLAVPRLVGLPDGSDLSQLTPEQASLYEEASALPHLTADDPPVLLHYDRPMEMPVTTLSIGIHHPRFGTLLADRMRPLGIPCDLSTGTMSPTARIDFLRRHFRIAATTQPTGR